MKALKNRQSIQRIQVNFQFPVYFTTNVFSPNNPIYKNLVIIDGELPKKILCIVDQAVANYHPKLISQIIAYHERHPKLLELVTSPLVISGGEECKNNPNNLSIIYEAISRFGIDRHSYLVTIGGGAILDMVGYSAATAHRGIRLIRIPTTVLSQSDSGVGVKNGINAYNKKNFLGSFAPPAAVVNDISFIKTLSDRDLRSGIAEAIKVALLKDYAFFCFLEKHTASLVKRDMTIMEQLIYKCAMLHLNHIAISGDPFEFGSSRPLDFGHWAGHKIEHLSNYRIRHGEAVAIGIALDSTYSFLMGQLSKKSWQRIINIIYRFDLPIYAQELNSKLDQPDNPNSLLHGLAEFRQHLGGKLTIILPKAIAKPVEVNQVSHKVVVSSIRLLKSLYQKRKENHAKEEGQFVSAY